MAKETHTVAPAAEADDPAGSPATDRRQGAAKPKPGAATGSAPAAERKPRTTAPAPATDEPPRTAAPKPGTLADEPPATAKPKPGTPAVGTAADAPPRTAAPKPGTSADELPATAKPKPGTPAVGAGALLQLLRDGAPRTRSELAAVTGLARSTVTQRVDALLASGLIGPSGEAASTGGRPPTTFAFKPHARVVLAADLGATHARLAVTDLAGQVLAETRADLDIAAGPQTVLDWVIEHGHALLSEIDRDPSGLLGVGIGLPGPVEHSTGRAVNPPIMPGWDGFDVPHYVGEHFTAPVLVDNDVNIMALGEHFTHWPDAEHLLFVKAATGIGCGIISDGQVFRGAQGAAGDMGHIKVAEPGPVCRCGNTGCLEAVASGAAIAAALAEQDIKAHSALDVVELARAGSVPALRLLRQAGRDIGEVLAAAVNLLNPAVIVIGGSLALAGDHLLAGVREVIYQRSLPLATQHLRIVQSRTGERAGAVGAGVMAINHGLSPSRVDALLA
ncbi:ROK family transcriptional regulator [Stackebrandtia nassauensis]|uniref:ROK family protein n=1 Tax=Stackebrandtia nassauensis (strain DSM 44728 / CIP 108903 / NRRL B-16338 / NBRC 102104 / LLR-40K-21) TaxID=446470 RepID=D3Q6Q8_STANL|nr:ROK family transcriptional regulator [Stackebrandtia nassauensis]ADD44301.1 ROK family protein [Stackebrandtia nassauensis DSM 44728]